MKIETQNVKSKTLFFKSTFGDKNAFVTLVEWANGEGHDITVSCNGDKHISLTSEEFDAIITLYHSFYLTIPE